jgi:hypothetical protein
MLSEVYIDLPDLNDFRRSFEPLGKMRACSGKLFLATTSPLSTSMIHISEEKLKRWEIRSSKIRVAIFYLWVL